MRSLVLALLVWVIGPAPWAAEAPAPSASQAFPPSLESYGDAGLGSVSAVLRNRVKVEPFNLVASLLFLGAIVHTFLAAKFRHLAHHVEEDHKARWWAEVQAAEKAGTPPPAQTVSVKGRLLHFLGEVEAVFGLWVIPLLIALVARRGAGTAIDYLEHRVHFQEPLFVVVIMALASTRPVLEFAEKALRTVASLGKQTPVAWWFSILTVGPILGSLITEPGAMTIAAMLLGRQFYRFQPPKRLAYATLGLLFVNVSVGGTLTHFAAPPVLMVANKWSWGTPYMLAHFGVQAVVGIVVSNILTFLALRKDFVGLADAWEKEQLAKEQAAAASHPVPAWVTAVHLLAMAWSVLNAHHPVLLIGGFLFFLAFHIATEDFQSKLDLRGPILVGFFLAGLVVHGGFQQWWIAPTLGGLGEWPLFLMSTVLTAFNDNAAITYLASLVPGFGEAMKHAVVAGAVTGGGLTVIANAPNPAGQSILAKHFPEGISPLGLLLGALGPTIVVAAGFMLIPH
ncbi:MAG: putative Na+/H+ antiporter [Verrucomicrobiales bacterium]|nr:putative Na+/H+ antiporter [Verrucomicrobiales bacterium]